MIVTCYDLDSKYAYWFYGVKNAEKAKKEILYLFGTEPTNGYSWTEQDIYEQSRKIIIRLRNDKDLK